MSFIHIMNLLYLFLSLIIYPFIDVEGKQQHSCPIVAIIDTGIDVHHPDLEKMILLDSKGKMVGWNAIDPAVFPNDDNGHGTHLAGIVSQLNNHCVKILPIKVLSEDGTGNVDNLVKGINEAERLKANILLISLRSEYYREDLAEAIDQAWKKGSLIIAAAGNTGSNRIVYPAGNLYVLGVAATTTKDTDLTKWKPNSNYELSRLSNSGIHVSMAAPGDKILAAMPTYKVFLNRYGFKLGHDELRGTSQAAAFVAGMAARYWSEHPNITNEEMYRLLEMNSSSQGVIWQPDRGYGQLGEIMKTNLVTPAYGGIYGQVVNSKNTPVQGVRIVLDNGQQETTNSSGMFRFANLPVGRITYKVADTNITGQLTVSSHNDALLRLILPGE